MSAPEKVFVGRRVPQLGGDMFVSSRPIPVEATVAYVDPKYGGALEWFKAYVPESALTAERERSARLEADAAYYKHRLQTIVPLFEEARDALCAIPLASAKLRNIDLSLGARMDVAGTYSREEWDAAITPTAKEQT